MLKLFILIALVFYGLFFIVRGAFQDYNWKEYTMEDDEYNEQEIKSRKKEGDSENRF